MNEIRIAKVKPNYIVSERNYPSFLGYRIDKTKQELISDYINNYLFKGSEIIEGIIQDYQSLDSLTVYIEINKENNYDTIFNSSYLEIIINKEKYYYFVNQVDWKNDVLLSLVCELDFWLTYWGNIKWNDNGFAFVKRKYEVRYIKDVKSDYYLINNSLNSSIHNLDNSFNFEHKFCRGLLNCILNYSEKDEADAKINGYHKPFFINQLSNNWYPSFLDVNRDGLREGTFGSTFLKVFGIGFFNDVGNSRFKNLMYYAFITPSNDVNDFTYEDALLGRGNLPNGCILVPIFFGDIDFSTFKQVVVEKENPDIPLGPEDFNNNKYSYLANLGNNFVISIVAYPIALHLLNIFYSPYVNLWLVGLERYALTIEGKNYWLWHIPISYSGVFKCSLKYPVNFMLKNILSLKKGDFKYQQKRNIWLEPKLFSNQFTEINLNSGNKFITMDNFNHIKFNDLEHKGNFNYNLSYSIAPHLYSQSIKIDPNYGDNKRITQLTLSESGFNLQQDLQLISTSNSYSAFMTGHKNAYNVSLAQGSLGVSEAKTKLHKAENPLNYLSSGVVGAYFGVKEAKQNLQGAKLAYKGIQAETKDLKAQPRSINDANTSDTYGDLIKERFSFDYQYNAESLNTFFFNSFYQINENQVEIVANYYNLHGYLFERLMVINNDFFVSRIYFDYFEINMISTAVDKSKGFNNIVLNWFNNLFNEGVRLWHHVKESKTAEITLPNINDYRYENWEISLFNEV